MAVKLSRPIVDMILSTLFFALMNTCVKMLSRIPTHEVVVFRALGMGLICFVLLKSAGLSPWGNHKRYLILRGLYGTLGVLLFFYTLKYLPLASAVTLQYLSPIFSSILAFFILKEAPAWKQWLFFSLSFLGVILIKGFDPKIGLFYWGIGIISPIFSGLAYNYVRKLKDYDHALVTMFYFPVVSLCLVGPYSFFHWVTPQGEEWLYLILTGIFAHFAQFYMTRAYQSEELAYVTHFNYLGLIHSLLIGYFFFGEMVTFLAGLGMILIVLGLILSSTSRQTSPIHKKTSDGEILVLKH